MSEYKILTFACLGIRLFLIYIIPPFESIFVILFISIRLLWCCISYTSNETKTIIESSEETIHKVVYPNSWITSRSACNKRGDKNLATIFQLFK